MLGITVIDKPAGISSHDVVNSLRRRLGKKRVGHAGTLDPIATGVLVMAVGPATRFLQYLPLEPKEYICQVQLGQATTTQDIEGEIVSEAPVPSNVAEILEQLIPQFIGPIEQLPPMHSAVKLKGKPLYTYARKGVEVDRKPRTIYIHSIVIEDWHSDVVEIRVSCSGGTYMRTLAHDLGAAIGCGAHLAGLHRTRVGSFSISDALQIEEVTADSLIPLKKALGTMPVYSLNKIEESAIQTGQAISIGSHSFPNRIALSGSLGEIIGIAEVNGNLLQPICVIPNIGIHAAL